MASPQSVLITGANRGIGLEFVKQLVNAAAPPKFIFACCRDPSKAKDLHEIADKHKGKVDIRPVKLTVDCESDIAAAVETVERAVGASGLNLIINNAGILDGTQSLGKLTKEKLVESYCANTVGPVLITQAFHPLLKAASAANGHEPLSAARAAVVMMSTGVASIADAKSTMAGYAYRCSKTALNMAGHLLALDFKEDNILVVNILPGYVATDMTDHAAGAISAEESVASMLTTIGKFGAEHNGGFYTRLGEAFPW